MATEQLKPLIQQGLAALKAGGQIAAGATAEIQNDVRNPQLKQALEQGSQTSQQWTQRIERAIQEAGGGGEAQNPILEAHVEVSKKIRQQAPDDVSRDLGIIAAGQLALHYWIASFGTLRTYAGQAGLSQTEQEMQACLDEAKQADDQHTEIAEQIMGRTE
ncbi:ferritin-like domain-containing protein [uncultured Hymenobacter sp.]|uniref:YciE/YciF ferroxidase family protein n=1 Tax=uncultured Hymenobacter sp. TaxID=170016 RepID=UPI0035CBCA33